MLYIILPDNSCLCVSQFYYLVRMLIFTIMGKKILLKDFDSLQLADLIDFELYVMSVCGGLFY